MEVLAFARHALDGLCEFAKELEVKLGAEYERLVVGKITGPVPSFFARAVAEIKVKNPNLDLRLVNQAGDETATLLLEGRIDLAVGTICHPLDYKRISIELLGDEELYLVARANHPAVQEPPVELQTLVSSAWILPPKTSAARQVIQREFARVGMRAPTNVVECECPLATLQLLRETDAVTILPASGARDGCLTDALTWVAIRTDGNFPTFGIFSRRDARLSASAGEFIQCLRRQATFATHARLSVVPGFVDNP